MTENQTQDSRIPNDAADFAGGPAARQDDVSAHQSGAGNGGDPSARRAVDGVAARYDRVCDHPDCAEEGTHRAPRARDRLEDYLWLCLDHVRDYNRLWDYYAGMSETEIEAQRRADATWRRPTWPLGAGRLGRDPNVADPFGVFETDSPGRRAPGAEKPAPRRRMTDAEQALAVLDLAPPATRETIKRRYKSLVKALHPDANGGDKHAEDRLKSINQAYAVLTKASPN